MKILITGITGLIGHHLMDALLKKGFTEIRGQYFSSRDTSEYTGKGIEMVRADICSEKDLENITAGCSVVVHSAAKVIDFGTKREFYTAHYDATHYLLKDSLRNSVEHFIYVSSIGVSSGIDRRKIIPDEATALVKTGVHYDDAKIDTEKLVKDFCVQNNMDYTIVRPSAVIGPGSVWVTEPLKRMDTAVGLRLVGGGKQPAGLIDAANLADGIALCITHPAARNQTYFFMDDWDVTWKQYFTDLAAMKSKKIRGSIPFGLAYFVASIAEVVFPLFGKNPPFAKKSVQATGTNRLVSTNKARSELEWKPEVTYARSMRRIKEWLDGQK